MYDSSDYKGRAESLQNDFDGHNGSHNERFHFQYYICEWHKADTKAKRMTEKSPYAISNKNLLEQVATQKF